MATNIILDGAISFSEDPSYWTCCLEVSAKGLTRQGLIDPSDLSDFVRWGRTVQGGLWDAKFQASAFDTIYSQNEQVVWWILMAQVILVLKGKGAAIVSLANEHPMFRRAELLVPYGIQRAISLEMGLHAFHCEASACRSLGDFRVIDSTSKRIQKRAKCPRIDLDDLPDSRLSGSAAAQGSRRSAIESR